MPLKKLALLATLSIMGVTSFATYEVIYPNVPVHFVKPDLGEFKPDLGEWIQADPVYSIWLSVGVPYDCTTIEPLENTQPLGGTYTKKFSGCKQLQERNVTTSEKNTVSGLLRNSLTNKENQVLNGASYSQNAIGTKIVTDCKYSPPGSNNVYIWYDIATNDAYTVTYGMNLDWNNVNKINNVNRKIKQTKPDSFVSDGYIYTRGAFKAKYEYFERTYYYYYYEVCRQPVAK
jgi:hypothetical protein